MSKKSNNDKNKPNKPDICVKEFMSHSTVCALYPKSSANRCHSMAYSIFTECAKQEKSGVSSGDGYSNTSNTTLGASPYKKSDGIVYVNTGQEIPFNGKVWNGNCYAYYTNGKWRYFTDLNGNACNYDGILLGHDN